MNINSVGSIMSDYYLNSKASTLFGSNGNASVPLVGSIDSTLQNYDGLMKLQGVSQNTELQDLINTVDPSNSIMNSAEQTPPATIEDLQNNMDMNLFNQFNGDSNSSIIDNNVLTLYNSLEDGTYTPSSTSISTSNPTSLYSNVYSIMNQLQTSGNFFSATA
jgi:hypothetical protein